MEILQKRYLFGEDFTLSRVFWKNIYLQYYVVEDKVREVVGEPIEKWKITGMTAIPIGRYQVVIDMSQRFGRRMLHLLNVPGFEGIRIHSGNSSKDTEGCLIVGQKRDEEQGTVSVSRAALGVLFGIINEVLQNGEQVFWTVEGLPQTDEHPISCKQETRI